MFGDLTCGVDLLLIERFESVLSRHPDRFPKRILTDRERDYCGDRLAEMAVRFSGKEAVMKCSAPVYSRKRREKSPIWPMHAQASRDSSRGARDGGAHWGLADPRLA